MNVTLHDYQEIAARFAIDHPKCGLFLDLGLGKTLISLAVLERVYDKESGHVLVVAPKSIAKATWAAEIDNTLVALSLSSCLQKADRRI